GAGCGGGVGGVLCGVGGWGLLWLGLGPVAVGGDVADAVGGGDDGVEVVAGGGQEEGAGECGGAFQAGLAAVREVHDQDARQVLLQIGRASCRGSGEWLVGGAVEKDDR